MKMLTAKEAKYGFDQLTELARAGPMTVTGLGAALNASASCRLRGSDYV